MKIGKKGRNVRVGRTLREALMIFYTAFFTYRLLLYGAGLVPSLAPGEWWCLLSILSYWGLRAMADVWKALMRFRSSLAVVLNSLANLFEVTSAMIQKGIESERDKAETKIQKPESDSTEN